VPIASITKDDDARWVRDSKEPMTDRSKSPTTTRLEKETPVRVVGRLRLRVKDMNAHRADGVGKTRGRSVSRTSRSGVRRSGRRRCEREGKATRNDDKHLRKHKGLTSQKLVERARPSEMVNAAYQYPLIRKFSDRYRDRGVHRQALAGVQRTNALGVIDVGPSGLPKDGVIQRRGECSRMRRPLWPSDDMVLLIRRASTRVPDETRVFARPWWEMRRPAAITSADAGLARVHDARLNEFE